MAEPNTPTHLDITLLGKEYRIACPPEEREALTAAVSYVDEKMHEISDRTKSNVAERIAVMAALNIAHEFLSAQAKGGEPVGGLDFAALRGRIADMEAQLDVVLAPQEKLF
ncbi:MAG: cell division protein ZapA [Azospira sp.]|jgi:cell division protein ZapA|nr:cell division protein ZapA [Azospira sp.]